MLKLKNIDNQVELKLTVNGYQFPDSPKDNWCLLKAVVTQGNDVFEVVDPALETTDIIQIMEWFQRLAARRLPRFAHLCFTEPCIEFEFLACKENTVRISINLRHEMRPTFKIKQFNLPFDDRDWNIVFELSNDDFRMIIDNIAEVAEKYPIRGKQIRQKTILIP